MHGLSSSTSLVEIDCTTIADVRFHFSSGNRLNLDSNERTARNGTNGESFSGFQAPVTN